MTLIEARFRGDFGRFRLNAAFSIPSDGVTAIFGPSGSGKTTLLQCVAGIVRPAEGHLIVGGEVWQDERVFLPPHRRRIGYVFQGANLFGHLSVEGNLRYGLRRRKEAASGGSIAFGEAVAMLGLGGLLGRRPEHLSGGERQRVAIGRALLAGPRLLVMDEPLTGLDQTAREEILSHLERLRDQLATPILYVSHDLAEVIRLAEHLVLMEAGRIVSVGSVSESLTRLDLPFALARDASSVLEVRASGYDRAFGLNLLDAAGGQFEVPGPALDKYKAFRLRVFASDVALSREEGSKTTILNRLPAQIVSFIVSGSDQVTVALRLGSDGKGAELLARVTRKSWEGLGFEAGQQVWALVKAVSLEA